MRFVGPFGAVGSSGPLLNAVTAVVFASGCVGADAALVDGECRQTDSTVTCCLKMNPGQYERCGATPPAQSEPINVGPPGLFKGEEQEERREEKERRCADYYARCIEKIGQKQGSLYGTSQCRDCFLYCSRYGFWPERMNKKKCPGA